MEDRLLVMTSTNDRIAAQIEKIDAANKVVFDDISTSVEAVEFIERIADQERGGIKGKLEKLITDALQGVYGGEYSIEFDYSIKNNRTSVSVMLVKNSGGLLIKRDIAGFGGGVADTISLPLKLLVLVSTPQVDRVLIADEPGKHLDINRMERFVAFLKTLCDKLQAQVIMVSHHNEVSDFLVNNAATVNMVTIKNGVSSIERIV
jgi:DNA repair exonuclease SbcCD ATPase subunit